MRITENSILEYLHDAVISNVCFNSSNDSKQLAINAVCDEDCGYADWAGRAVIITLSDVVVASALLWGYVAGQDIVNSFREGVSAVMHQRITELDTAGISAPRNLLTIALQSGSEIEVACAEIYVTAVA